MNLHLVLPVLPVLDLLVPGLLDLLVLLALLRLAVLQFQEQPEDVVALAVVSEVETNRILLARLHLLAHPSVRSDEPDLCGWKI